LRMPYISNKETGLQFQVLVNSTRTTHLVVIFKRELLNSIAVVIERLRLQYNTFDLNLTIEHGD